MPTKLNSAGKLQEYDETNGRWLGKSTPNVINDNNTSFAKKGKIEVDIKNNKPITKPIANKIEDINKLEIEETPKYYTKDNWEETIGKQIKPKQKQAIKNIIDNIEKEVGGIGDDKYILKNLEIEFLQDEESRKLAEEIGIKPNNDVRVNFKLELESVKDHPILIRFNRGILFNVGEQGGYYTYNKNYNKKPLTLNDIKWMNYYSD